VITFFEFHFKGGVISEDIFYLVSLSKKEPKHCPSLFFLENLSSGIDLVPSIEDWDQVKNTFCD